MLKKTFLISILVSTCLIAAESSLSQLKPEALMTGIAGQYHPVTTKSPLAQAFFNQGLLLTYFFNYPAAYKSFAKALESDPGLAMAEWGMALTLGENINFADTQADLPKAYEHIQKALVLSQKRPLSANEKAYIDALAQRYSSQKESQPEALRRAYYNAMKKVALTYPDDLDAQALFAESAMDISPWALWKNGQPAEGTEEILESLTYILKQDPDHLGANHYYIHAVEDSPHPEWGLMSANRLEKVASSIGHLLHMPSHIYFRTGDYKECALVNEKAVEADRAFIAMNNLQGEDALHYLTHDLNMLVASYVRLGSFQGTFSALQVQNLFLEKINEITFLGQKQQSLTYFALLAFHQWTTIISLPEPKPEEKFLTTCYLFAKALSLAKLKESAKSTAVFKEFAALQETYNDQPYYKTFFTIASLEIQAALASTPEESSRYLEEAIELLDPKAYDKPPFWYQPLRPLLGSKLYQRGLYNEAEAVFRKDLDQNPRSGRSLFGLLQTLKKLGRTTDAFWIESEYKKAWQDADIVLSMDDL